MQHYYSMFGGFNLQPSYAHLSEELAFKSNYNRKPQQPVCFTPCCSYTDAMLHAFLHHSEYVTEAFETFLQPVRISAVVPKEKGARSEAQAV